MSYKRPLTLDNGTFREIRDGETPFNTNVIFDLIDQFIVCNEIPKYDIDNIKLFTTLYPFKYNSICIYLNGIRLMSGINNDYIIISDTQFLLDASIDYEITDNILVDYKRSDLGI